MTIFAAQIFDNRTFIVTGASSGLGRCVALSLAELGARVVALGRDEDRLEQTCVEMGLSNHLKVLGDLSSADTAYKTIRNARDLIDGRIDGIFHSAGVSKIRPARMTKTKDIDHIMGASLYGSLGIARAAASREFFSAEGGSIVFMSSVAGVRGQVGMSAYGASRAAISGLVKNLACELAPKSVRVNSIIAGAVETEMHAQASRGMDESSLLDYKSRHLLGFGSPLDIANAAIFLLGPASKWITGSSMFVDGGYSAR